MPTPRLSSASSWQQLSTIFRLPAIALTLSFSNSARTRHLMKRRLRFPSDQRPDSVDRQLLAQVRELRERIKARRGDKLITTDVLEQVREERDEDLHESITGI